MSDGIMGWKKAGEPTTTDTSTEGHSASEPRSSLASAVSMLV